MRILHTESSLGWGGQEMRILDEARGLIGRGHSVSIAAPAEARIFSEAARWQVPIDPVAISRKGWRAWRAMRSFIAARRPQLINTHSSTDTWMAALGCATLSDAPPIVRTRHISAAVPRDPATRWLYQRATCHIVTTGTALREQLVRDNRFDPARITSVPTGIDTERFRPSEPGPARRIVGLPEDRLLVGIVATLRSWKGHLVLLDAFASAAIPHVELVIVGDGPMRGTIETHIRTLGLTGRVHLPGQQADVVPWLNALDVFVLPSYANEGVPQALLQAMLCGLPCVTTAIGAISEAARHEDTALVVPPKDCAALAQALTRLLNDPIQARALGQRARAACEQRFSAQSMLDAMEAVFRSVIEAPRARR